MINNLFDCSSLARGIDLDMIGSVPVDNDAHLRIFSHKSETQPN